MHFINWQHTQAFKHGVVVIEDLKVSGMFGTAIWKDDQKLAKSIAYQGFYEFRRQLEYKCQWYGSELVVVDRFFPSSKTYSNCGHLQDMLLNLRNYDCSECDLSILLRFKRQYEFERCGRFDSQRLWMSNRRWSQLKQEANIKMSLIMKQ